MDIGTSNIAMPLSTRETNDAYVNIIQWDIHEAIFLFEAQRMGEFGNRNIGPA
jgi:hypothetical protein